MSDDAPPIAISLAELSTLCGKVPKAHASWSYQHTVDFKAAHAKAVRVCKASRPTRLAVQAALETLRRFHKE